MRIIQIVTQMEPAGAQVCALALHEKFLDEGYNSKLVFLYDKTGCYSERKEVHCIFNKKPTGLVDLLVIVSRLILFLYRHKDFCVITHTTYSNIIGGLCTLIVKNKKVIAVQHGLPVAEPKFASNVDRFLGGFIYKKIVCVSNTVKKSFSEYSNSYIQKLHVIHNGLIPCDVNNNLSPLEKYFTDDFINVLVVGRFHEQKNHRIIFPGISANRKVRLIMIGDGELKEQYKEDILEYGIEHRVIMLGELERSCVISCMRLADVFIFPSKYETFGLVLVEAMSCGLPVIASDIPAMREIAGDAAVLLDPYSENEWSYFFEHSLCDLDYEAMSASSLIRARMFSFDNMYHNYRNLLDDY